MRIHEWVTLACLVCTGSLLTACGARMADSSSRVESCAVYIKSDGLWRTAPGETPAPAKIDQDGKFRRPLVSPDGKQVAYRKDDMICVAPLWGEERLIVRVGVGVVDYAWGAEDELVFSGGQGGLSIFDTKEMTARSLEGTNGIYDGIACDGEGSIYANTHHREAGTASIVPGGIIRYDVASATEQVIVPAQEPAAGEAGCNPMVAGLSPNGSTLFVWYRPYGDSAVTNGVPLAVYDTDTETLMQPEGMESVLPYDDCFCPEPTEGKNVVFVSGGGKEMNQNKALAVYRVTEGKAAALTGEDQTVITPAYDQKGRNVYYSAGLADNDLEVWDKLPQSICKMDVRDHRVSVVSKNTESFDMAPCVLDGREELVFVRRLPGRDDFSLIYSKNGKERELDSGLLFDKPFNGHFAVSDAICFYVEP